MTKRDRDWEDVMRTLAILLLWFIAIVATFYAFEFLFLWLIFHF